MIVAAPVVLQHSEQEVSRIAPQQDAVLIVQESCRAQECDSSSGRVKGNERCYMYKAGNKIFNIKNYYRYLFSLLQSINAA